MNVGKWVYPKAKKSGITHSYFNRIISDPYSWLEDDSTSDTKEWIEQENSITQDYFSRIPFRESIRQRLNKIWDYEKYSVPFRLAPYTYYYKNNGLQNHSVLYRQDDNGETEVFIDPNMFSIDGSISLSGIDFSKDVSLAAFQISESGSDWRKVMVMNTHDKSMIGDILINIKFSFVAWKGNDGFFYSRYPAANDLSAKKEFATLYYHKIGTPQSDDEMIFGNAEDPRRFVLAYLTEDERFLVIGTAMAATDNELYIKDLSEKDGEIKCIVNNFDSQTSVLTNVGSRLYIYTNLHAPNFKVVTVDFNNPTPNYWEDFLPETENVFTASTGGGVLFCNYAKNAISFVCQYNMDGELLHTLNFPSAGTASGFGTRIGEKETYYVFTSYICPPTIYKYDISSGISEVYKSSDVCFDQEKYESKQVFYTSGDGTQIPMIITHKKGIVLNGKNPALLHAYGGFGFSLTPNFSTSNIIFLEQGGVYAVPNVRGGGEYGKNWHDAGTKFNKHNVFDDFAAAAEYLFLHRYTSKEYLAISGASNGGLLVGATITKQPDFCKVALLDVAVLDMLRYNKFTLGEAWAHEYGQPEDSPEMFEYLLGYSPYHNLKPGKYPATLITTADHDDRVVASHSFKFTAGLQESQQGTAPVLISVEINSGHGAGKSTEQIINSQTDKWAFLFANMEVDFNDVLND